MSTVSLIVSTYNWKEALALCLASIRGQSERPLEVLVADDGSDRETGDVVVRAAMSFSIPVRHVWQRDVGFRAARIRNIAMARARGDYLIHVDGDSILHRHFVRDYHQAAESGCFVRGQRVFLPAAATERLLWSPTARPSWRTRGLRKRYAAFRLPWLTRFLLDWRPGDVRGHNLACWRSDAIAVNGYDERMVGWGREDDEFAQRLLNAGLRKRRLRFSGIVYHLHHEPRPRPEQGSNDEILRASQATGIVRCELGLEQHLDS
ncbi:MAG: glycosyltransferase family 2 protein [Gemmatimonadota bacterium]